MGSTTTQRQPSLPGEMFFDYEGKFEKKTMDKKVSSEQLKGMLKSWDVFLQCLGQLSWMEFRLILDDGEDVNVYDGLDDQGFSCNIHTGCLGGGEVVACAAKYAHDYPFGPDR